MGQSRSCLDYFRYDSSLQLYLAGESLMGWMVADLRRGVDLLLARGDVDPAKIALLDAVAGGGDPAAVAAAIDDRIAVAVPFNFGGLQPETRLPLPDDAETSFNYAGSGSWESTRNLHRSAADGFLPWVIVGSIAPRKLVFAHEFNWDQARDPVWKRLQRIYEYFDAADSLAFTHGRALRMAVVDADGTRLPLVLLLPKTKEGSRPPVVVGVSQLGKQGFLQQRAATIAALVESGLAVCLPDLRGTGETRGDEDRGPDGGDTARSATELMLGARLRDVRTLLAVLRQRDDIDVRRLGIWGDSFTEPNTADVAGALPRRIDGRPRQSEPGGALLALAAGLYEDDVRAVVAGGGLAEFLSVLGSPYVYVSHDSIVPGLLTTADMPDLALAFAPRPLRLTRSVDGWNRLVPPPEVRATYAQIAKQYHAADAAGHLQIEDAAPGPADAVAWWTAALEN